MKAISVLLAVLVALSCSSLTARAELAIDLKEIEREGESDCFFWSDDFSLILRDGGRVIQSDLLCASYGEAKLYPIADKNGLRFAAVVYGIGRGTNATTDYLAIYDITANGFNEIMRVPVYWATGPAESFMFEYEFNLMPDGTLTVALRGDADEESDCCVPPELVYSFQLKMAD